MKLFEILQKLNDGDAQNGTAHVGICNDVVSVDKKGNNGYVKIGIPSNVAQEIVLDSDKKALMLLIIDRKEYDILKNGNDWTFIDSLPQAVHVLTYQLRCDEDYKRTWVDNIAMAFQDAFWQYMNGKNLSIDFNTDEHGKERIHTISNEAAKQFVSNLTQTNAAS